MFENSQDLISLSYCNIPNACNNVSSTTYIILFTVNNFLLQLYPMIITTMVEETERIVVMTTTQTIKEMIETCGTSVFANNEHDLRVREMLHHIYQ